MALYGPFYAGQNKPIGAKPKVRGDPKALSVGTLPVPKKARTPKAASRKSASHKSTRKAASRKVRGNLTALSVGALPVPKKAPTRKVASRKSTRKAVASHKSTCGNAARRLVRCRSGMKTRGRKTKCTGAGKNLISCRWK